MINRVGVFVLLAVATVGCGISEQVKPEPPLPVKCMDCDVDHENCIVRARFTDMHSCEFYKGFYVAHCDYVSDPRKIICERPLAPLPSDSKVVCTY
jgi:hypothetical protein